ncbi:hypothetical protein [Actinophytocola gossypii]|uniref:DUF3558 domain-containing protein n=1 Tax=Actinophytocola gossypii TaxID=2812003 RepID=A0ABT2J770_9PSEU|nr:hypothetical protein [Actinophytocola gossypii]MCT2583700.1 hypothetical protein [Actinophytocola gossypii]
MRRLVAVLCCAVLLGAAGCATTGGVEVAGQASQVEPPPVVPPLPSGTPESVDAVAVLRADPAVPEKIKSLLVPCEGGSYPVVDRYADLTRDGVVELVATVLPCHWGQVPMPSETSGIGLAGYVYDLSADPPTRLLALENGVELLVDRGNRLVATASRYLAEDELCCPTDQRITFYTWNGTGFVETDR